MFNSPRKEGRLLKICFTIGKVVFTLLAQCVVELSLVHERCLFFIIYLIEKHNFWYKKFQYIKKSSLSVRTRKPFFHPSRGGWLPPTAVGGSLPPVGGCLRHFSTGGWLPPTPRGVEKRFACPDCLGLSLIHI